MRTLHRAKMMLAIVSFGLFVSAVTIWPARWELETLVSVVWGDREATGALTVQSLTLTFQ